MRNERGPRGGGQHVIYPVREVAVRRGTRTNVSREVFELRPWIVQVGSTVLRISESELKSLYACLGALLTNDRRPTGQLPGESPSGPQIGGEEQD